jgi:hypothetical protein
MSLCLGFYSRNSTCFGRSMPIIRSLLTAKVAVGVTISAESCDVASGGKSEVVGLHIALSKEKLDKVTSRWLLTYVVTCTVQTTGKYRTGDNLKKMLLQSLHVDLIQVSFIYQTKPIMCGTASARSSVCLVTRAYEGMQNNRLT